ncbi:hypothetical protein [Sneathiella glossodoripedis]|uniref:hypothetical protein n=1 Tax=Sneathiella glossodoripedis TaxID=418853 RepID=UPI00131F1254|nr:hypothetical protein [Sneathiella glossodoripedis]
MKAKNEVRHDTVQIQFAKSFSVTDRDAYGKAAPYDDDQTLPRLQLSRKLIGFSPE